MYVDKNIPYKPKAIHSINKANRSSVVNDINNIINRKLTIIIL